MQRLTIDVDSPEYAWLNLTKEDLVDLRRPLTPTSKNEKEDFHLKVLAAMKNPEYFQWTCKHLLNVDLLPTQVVILQELWNHNFPIYIASRGFGKLLNSNELVRVKDGWTKIKDLNIGDFVYGGDGKLTKIVNKSVHQTNLNMYRITFRDGRQIECCEDHTWKVWDKNKNRNENKKGTTWSDITTKEMFKNYYWDRKDSKSKDPNKRMKEFRYAIPINKPLMNESSKSLLLHPYVVGVLLGDGSLTQKTISICSKDEELINKFKSLLPEGYTLSRCFQGKDYHIIRTNNNVPTFYKLCESIGIYGHTSHTKFIPNDYLFSSYEQRLDLLKGLLDTDGYSSINVIEYYTISDQLAKNFLDLARSCGLHCKDSIKESWIGDKQYTDCHRISIYTDQEIFSLSRKSKYLQHTKSKAGQSKYDKVFITNIEYLHNNGEGYCIEVDNDDHTYITKDYIVTHNSFLLAVYCLLRNIFIPDSKIVIVGAAFRQSKIIFDYMDNIWKKSPILHTICSDSSGPYRAVDRCEFKINGSVTIAVPLGNGDKIRGLRAHTIIADEFNSIPVEIYETVVSGFASVSKDPVENVKRAARKRHLMKIGKWSEQEERVYEESSLGNQTILSGTCGYDFEPFAKYWKKYHALVKYKGDLKAVANATGESIDDEETHSKLDYKSFCVIRIPYELIPEGFMDDQTVSRAKTTMHTSTYSREYAAVFPKDSQGFFKRSLIEACTASESNCNLPNWPYWCPQPFQVVTNGSRAKQYVFGIDPASEEDNFAISVLELHDEHQRCVYCWTTNKKDFQERKSMGMTDANDYYSFCCRKIRELMRVFPCVRIAIDSQGGGYAVAEGLADTDKLLQGERPILPIIEEGVEKPTDTMPGEHILEFISFADATWTSQANHGLRKDMEDKVLLFPQFDVVALAVISERDKIQFESLKQKYGTNNAVRLFDTLEDAYMEIQELKEELSLITVTRTESGRERFSTPEVKLGTGKKGRMRKDRYSALLMANMVARTLFRTPPAPSYINIGRVSGQVDSVGDGKAYASGPDFMKGVNTNCFKAIKKS